MVVVNVPTVAIGIVGGRCRDSTKAQLDAQELGTKPSDLVRADDGAGEGCEGKVDVGAPFVADGETAELSKPGEGALDHPAMAPEFLAGLNVPSGVPRHDGAGATLGPAAAMIVAFVGVQLARSTARTTPVSGAHAQRRWSGAQ